MRYFNVFLSHSSADKPFVEKVADALTRRGLIPWLDVTELHAGDSLSKSLREAIQAPDTWVAAFLSDEANKSPWVADELQLAVAAEQANPHRPIIPICLGDAAALIANNTTVQNLWRLDDNRVDRLYIEPKLSDRDPEDVAQRLAAAILRRTPEFRTCPNIYLYLDQRGSGRRTGPCSSSLLHARSGFALVLRPDRGSREDKNLINSHTWQASLTGMRFAVQQLGSATDPSGEPRTVHILGRAQHALFWALGRQLDYSKNFRLICHHPPNTPNTTVTVQGNPAFAPAISLPDLPTPATSRMAFAISGPRDICPDVKKHIKSQASQTSLHVLKHDVLHTPEAAHTVAHRGWATLEQIRQSQVVEHLDLYAGMPAHLFAAIASMSGLSLPKNIRFWEFDSESYRAYRFEPSPEIHRNRP